MAKRSAADLAIPLPEKAPIRRPPPAHLNGAARAVWNETMAALPADWLTVDNGPVLERYCCVTVRIRELDKLVAQTDPRRQPHDYARFLRLQARETRLLLALARSLRITKQARTHKHTAANSAAKAVPQRNVKDLFK